MADPKDYKYNLFLSWTGVDKDLKNQIRAFFVEKSGNPKYCYDSDEFCAGWFRENYIEALYQSKVYLLIVSDDLLDNKSGRYSEVQRELRNALTLDSDGRLNMIVLNVSPRFKAFKPEKRYDDEKGYFFYSNTQGASNVYAEQDGEGKISQEKLLEVYEKVTHFVSERDEGHPVSSQHPHTFIRDDAKTIKPDPLFMGRGDELSLIKKKFDEGAQIVVLSGMGGIGKTRLASQFAGGANADKSARCLQIVHVQEMATDTNGLRLLVSQTRFNDAFREAHKDDSDNERYEAKLEALKDVPEYCLLILDNFNLANEDSLYEMVNQLRCRLIVTTRAHVEPDNRHKTIASIRVDKLDDGDAYELFKRASNRDLSKAQFDTVWKAVSGHTITLCIMANILKKHHNKTVEELVDKLNASRLSEITDKVQFSHNESSDSTDMLGHLKTLFDVSKLNDECKDVLRNMSMLSDGLISIADLQRYMGLGDDNAIVSLIDEGWLEERMLDDGAYVYLHPVISQLVFNIDPPTEKNVAGIVNYLAEFYDRQKEALVYADAHLMVSRLYYALYKLAASTNRLCIPLWDKYVEINHLLGDLDEVNKQRKALNALLHNDDQQLVNYFYDFSSLEAHPDDFDNVIRQYENYTIDSTNYKRLLQMMPIVGKYAKSEQDLAALRGLVGAILPVAMAQRDDLAVLSCLINLTDKTYSAKKISAYIKQRRKEGAEEGKLLLLEMYNYAINAFGDVPSYLNKWLASMDDDRELSKMFLRHPAFYSKTKKLYKRMSALPASDTMSFYVKFTTSAAEELATDETVDVVRIIDAVAELLTLLQSEGLSLMSGEEVISRTIALLKQFPINMQGNLQRFVSVPLVSAEKITIADLSKLTVACSICDYLAGSATLDNRKEYIERAYLQSKHILNVQRKLYAPNHYKVIDALIRHGNLCSRYGASDSAVQAYEEAYSVLKSNTVGQSAQLFELCNAIFAGNYYANAKNIDLPWCKDVKQTGMESARSDGDRIALLSNYVQCLAQVYGRYAREMPEKYRQFFINMIDDGLKEYFALTSDVKRLETRYHQTANFATRETYVVLWNAVLVSKLQSKIDVNLFLSFYEKMQSSPVKKAALCAKQFYNELKYRHCDGSEKIQCAHKAMELGFATRARIDGTVAIAIDLVSHIVDSAAQDGEDFDAPMRALLDELIGKNKKLRYAFAWYVDAYLNVTEKNIKQLSSAMYAAYNKNRSVYVDLVKELTGSKAHRKAMFYALFLEQMYNDLT